MSQLGGLQSTLSPVMSSRKAEKRISVFCPYEYRGVSQFGAAELSEKFVLVTKPEQAQTQKQFEEQVVTRPDLNQYLCNNPETKVYRFDHVQNDNFDSVPNKKRKASVTSNESGLNDHRKTNVFKDSIIRQRVYETLNSGLKQTAYDMNMPHNFCYVQVSSLALPQDHHAHSNVTSINNQMALSISPKNNSQSPYGRAQLSHVQKPKSYGSFLSLKAIDDGTNIAFMAIKDMIKYQKEAIISIYRKKSSRNAGTISTKSFKRPAVKVSIMMLYNSEIFDLLND